MSRSISTDFNTQITSNSVRPFFAVDIGYENNTLRLWTGYHEVSFDNKTFIGSGSLLRLSNVSESADTKATGLQIVLTGLDDSILNASMSEVEQNIPCTLYFGVLTTTSNATEVVDTPYKMFEGFLDVVNIDNDGETVNIEFRFENKLISLEKPTDKRYTDQDQKQLFPDDKGLEFVASIQNKAIVWGGGNN